MDVITEAVNLARSVIQQSAAGDGILSCVLDDAFHFMDHLLRLLSKAHLAFNQFAHDFSEAMFIRDPDDEAKVGAVLERKGLSWEYYEWAKGSVFNLHIRRYIPKSEILHEHLVMLFKAYIEVYCSTKRG